MLRLCICSKNGTPFHYVEHFDVWSEWNSCKHALNCMKAAWWENGILPVLKCLNSTWLCIILLEPEPRVNVRAVNPDLLWRLKWCWMTPCNDKGRCYHILFKVLASYDISIVHLEGKEGLTQWLLRYDSVQLFVICDDHFCLQVIQNTQNLIVTNLL